MQACAYRCEVMLAKLAPDQALVCQHAPHATLSSECKPQLGMQTPSGFVGYAQGAIYIKSIHNHSTVEPAYSGHPWARHLWPSKLAS